MNVRHLTLVDPGRPVRASHGFAGSATRRIDVTVWSPDGAPAGRRLPLLIYSHGTFGSADNAMYLVRDLVAHGYVVAAPDYPLTSRAAYTHVIAPDIGDVASQVRDIRFVIDRLLADPPLAALVDPARIGMFGHSLGAVTGYFASFGVQTRDPRVRATALLGGGDPVGAALSNQMGLAGTANSEVSTPALFVSAEHDVFARLTGRPFVAYARVPGPKYEVTIAGGVHVWLSDDDTLPQDGRNPDCRFFDATSPGFTLPGCADRPVFTTPAHEQDIARYAVRNFFDAYLKDDRAASGRLLRIGEALDGAAIRHEEARP